MIALFLLLVSVALVLVSWRVAKGLPVPCPDHRHRSCSGPLFSSWAPCGYGVRPCNRARQVVPFGHP